MRKDYALLAVLLLAFSVNATQLAVYEPVATTVSDNGFIDLGTVGPGQTAEITAESKITEGGIQGKGGVLDQLIFLSVPAGWGTTPSKQYGSPMKAIMRVPADAEDGDYILTMQAVDEPPGEMLGNVTFRAMVHVSRSVLVVDVQPDKATTGAGQPAGYYVTINNNGFASDVFEVSSEGVPDWHYRMVVFVPKGSSKIVRYEVVGNEEQEYRVKLKVRAPFSSELLKADRDVTLDINTNLISDLQATGHGLLLFPGVEQPVYSLMGLLSNLLFR